MTFERGFPQRLTAIDDLTRGDHWYLREGDVCHFIGEYTARKGSAYSATNTLILDFKMSVLNDGLPVWRHKEAAIATAAAVLRQSMHPSVLDQVVFVPMPPSKAKGDAGYDDRLVRMLQMVRPDQPLDARELLVQTRSVEPSHQRSTRPQASDIVAALPHRRDAGGAGAGGGGGGGRPADLGGALPGGEAGADAALRGHRGGGAVPGAAGAGGDGAGGGGAVRQRVRPERGEGGGMTRGFTGQVWLAAVLSEGQAFPQCGK